MKTLLPLLIALRLTAVACADDFTARCMDRTVIERVYHAHRLGTKQAFEEAMPQALIEQFVSQDRCKEAVLAQTYGVTITPAMLAAEVERINTTTRAPEILAEIKRALDDDAARFARAMARPILVERELRHRFDNDDHLHSAQRHQAEQARASLLAGKPVKDLHDVTWQLTPRPTEIPTPTSAPVPTHVKASSGAYSVEATAQLSQVIAPGQQTAPGQTKKYFEDLDPELQRVLRVQLQKPGDVSAVIETPRSFLLFQVKTKSAERLSVVSLSLPKLSYDEWLVQQPK